MPEAKRPLSPHLQIYRWQVSNTTSILHRLTGVLLALGILSLVGWLLALASGPAAYPRYMLLFGTLPGQLLLLGWSFSFFYHLCNGVRHLGFDAGWGFDRQVARRSGLLVIGLAVALTVLFWAFVLGGGRLP